MPAAEQLSFPIQPILLGVAGYSGSGKTTLARELAEQLDATLFPLDLYYRDLGHLTPEDRQALNFDHPDSLEHALFTQHLRLLRNGQSIERPIYDFARHTRIPERFDRVTPNRFVVVEGILGLHFPALRELYDLSVYVDCPHDVCLLRRIHRDTRERGRTEQSVRDQYASDVQPMADLYVLPSRNHATLTVSGCEALDWSIEQVLRQLRLHHLLP